MNKLKGIYRLTWYKNQIVFHTITPLLRFFHDSGIETMVLKGAALTALYYRNYGLRPMNDFDVLVHAEQVLPAVDLLLKRGWTPIDFTPTGKYISVSYSHGFTNGDGQAVDLHWHVLSQGRETHSDDDFWKGAAAARIHGITTRVLNPTDQLLHICVHGARWNYTPPFRWIPDAMMILNTAEPGINWDRLIEQARKHRLVLPLRDTLTYIRSLVNAPVPSEILRSMQATPTTKTERIEYKVAVNPPARWTAALDLWCQHARLMGNAGLIRKLVGFPGFLERIWGASLWKLPFCAFLKLITLHHDRRGKGHAKKERGSSHAG